MRGFGEFQRAQIRHGDQRWALVFGHLRAALDEMEAILMDADARPKPQPPAPAPVTVPQSDEPRPLAVSTREAAHLLGISHASVWNLLQAGTLQRVKIGGRTVIRVADLDALLRAPEK